MSKRPVYGFPCVADPNDFIPDMESSSPTEVETHRLACRSFGSSTYEPNKGCFSEYNEKGDLVFHVTRTSWGIGTNLILHCDGCGEPLFGDPSVICHECFEQDFCEDCWVKHERDHDEGRI